MPADTKEIYHVHSETGLFQYSGMFENYIREIRFWQMDPKFFSTFPELYDDMVYSEPLPRSLSRNGFIRTRSPSTTITEGTSDDDKNTSLPEQALVLHIRPHRLIAEEEDEKPLVSKA